MLTNQIKVNHHKCMNSISVYEMHSLKHKTWPKKQEILQFGTFCDFSNFRQTWKKYV